MVAVGAAQSVQEVLRRDVGERSLSRDAVGSSCPGVKGLPRRPAIYLLGLANGDA